MCTGASILAAAGLLDGHRATTHWKYAREVARELVVYLQRPGNQAQMSVHIAAPPPEHDLVQTVSDHISTHLDGELITKALAEPAGVSERHLGRTPGRHVRQTRAEAAANLLATRCGFTSPSVRRRAFLEHRTRNGRAVRG